MRKKSAFFNFLGFISATLLSLSTIAQTSNNVIKMDSPVTGDAVVYVRMAFDNQDDKFNTGIALSQDTVKAWGDYSAFLRVNNVSNTISNSNIWDVRDGSSFKTSSTPVNFDTNSDYEIWMDVNFASSSYTTYVKSVSDPLPVLIYENAAWRKTSITALNYICTPYHPTESPLSRIIILDYAIVATVGDTPSGTHGPFVNITTESNAVNGPFNITILFNEPVAGFELSDITISNGIVNSLTTTDNMVFTAQVTPASEGDVSISVAAGVATNTALAPNYASRVKTITYIIPDTQAPTVSLATQSNSVNGSFDVTITFSETVSGFVSSDITVSNGSVGKLTSANSRVFTARISPSAPGTVSVSIKEGVASDEASNANLASAVLSVTYSIYNPQLSSSNLPILIVDTKGKTIKSEPKIDATLGIISNESGINNINDPFNNYNGNIGIETRGNSSETWPKKPYLFETRDESGGNYNVSLLGLPSENDWILHAPYVDKTLMRNAFVYQVLRELGWYAPRTAFCEMIINDEYLGVFLLVEKLKIDKNRLDIEEASATNTTGGFLLELTTSDRLGPGEPYFTCSNSRKVVAIKYPKAEEITPAQIAYAKKCFDNFEQALDNNYFSGNNDYKKFINVPSFVDHMLILEIFRELDAFYASHHFNIDTDGKIKMGPGWDFNRCLGNYSGYNEYVTDDLWLIQPRGSEKVSWPNTIYQDENFMDQYKARYQSLRENTLSTAHLYSLIDEFAALLDEAKDRNFAVWDVLGVRKNQPQAYDTYEEEVDYIKNWMAERFDFLDNEWDIDYYPTINEIYADGENSGNQWIELFNPFPRSVDVSGWKLKLNTNEKTSTIPSNCRISPDSYVVICANKSKFMQAYPSVSSNKVFEALNFTFNSDNLTLQLTNGSNIVKNEIKINAEGGWPVLSKSGEYSIGVNAFQTDNKKGYNWNWSSTSGGSPCEKNSLFDYSGLIISEVMSSNKNTIEDEYGKTGDWIELCNNSTHAINLAGLFLSDEETIPWKSRIRGGDNQYSSIIEPGECALFWADGDTSRGAFHVDFKLSASGDSVVLSNYNGFKYTTIDKVYVPSLLTDYSYQRTDNEANTWIETNNPSPRISNNNTNSSDVFAGKVAVRLYPNPVSDNLNIDINLNTEQNIDIRLFDFQGKQVNVILESASLKSGCYSYNVRLSDNIKQGVYVVKIKGEDFVTNRKIILLR